MPGVTLNVVESTGPVVWTRVAPGSQEPTGQPLSTLNPVMPAEASDQLTVIEYW